MILHLHIDSDTEKRLRFISLLLDRDFDSLAESSVSEAALKFFRNRSDDPARLTSKGVAA